MKNKGLNIVSPKEFTVRLSECGLDTCRGSYKTMKDEDALKLAFRVIDIITHDFIHDNKAESFFRYDLGCILLGTLEGYDDKKLIEDIKDYKKLLGKWRLQKNESKKG